MPQETIARRVDEFNVGFTAQIGPELSTVFDREQADLRAAGVPVAALGEGDSAPDAELLDATGSATSLRQIRGGAPTVLVFYRGAWCPYCNLTLRTYQQELLPALQDRGAQLVAVSPQTPEGTEQAIANGERVPGPVRPGERARGPVRRRDGAEHRSASSTRAARLRRR